MGKCVSRHYPHNGRVVNDAPYEPAAVQASEDTPGEQQKNPVAGKPDDPVYPQEVNWEVLDELPSVSTNEHDDSDNPPNNDTEAPSDQVSDSQIEPNITEIHESSKEKCMTSDCVGDRGDGNEAKDSHINESKKSKPSLSSLGVAVEISPKQDPSASSHLHQVTLKESPMDLSGVQIAMI